MRTTATNRITAILLAAVLWIVETCCPEIKSVRGQVLQRSFLALDLIL
jgi:hypothetical protein